MAERKVSIGLVQMATRETREQNLAHALAGIREAVAQGAQVVVLEELFAHAYFCQTEDAVHFDLAEPIPGPTTRAVAELAAELGVVVVTPVFERRAPGLYHNTAAVLGTRGELLGLYRKMHLPHDPCFFEKFYFTPGDLGFIAVDTPLGRLGPLICYDEWFPEAARLAALAGAEVLVFPTAIGWLAHEKEQYGAAQLRAWQTIQKSHAIANGCFVACVNRVGLEPGRDGGVEFWGHSFVCDPYGEVLEEAGAEEQVLVVDCDLGLVEKARRQWPFLRDRRVEAYSGLGARMLDAVATSARGEIGLGPARAI